MSMISTANYEARKFGVRSAMPGFIGRKLCPQLIFVKHNFESYSKAAEIIRGVFAVYDPDFSAVSLDEAYLNVTDYLEEHGLSEPDSGSKIASEIRRRIEESTKLTASAGVACNSMLAKIASDFNKPNGQYVLPPTKDAILKFMEDLPVRKVGGVGKVTERILKELGIATCGELQKRAVEVCRFFKPRTARFLLRASLGIASESSYSSQRSRKSISVDRTFKPIFKQDDLDRKCIELCKLLSEDVQRRGAEGKNVTLKLKTTEFIQTTRSETLTNYISSAGDLATSALRLLRKDSVAKLRLMGVRLSSLREDLEPGSSQSRISTFFRPRDSSSAPENIKTSSPSGPSGNGTNSGRRRYSSVAVHEISDNSEGSVHSGGRIEGDNNVFSTINLSGSQTGQLSSPGGQCGNGKLGQNSGVRNFSSVAGLETMNGSISDNFEHSNDTCIGKDSDICSEINPSTSSVDRVTVSSEDVEKSYAPESVEEDIFSQREDHGLRLFMESHSSSERSQKTSSHGTQCPVCNTILNTTSNIQLNRHLDRCLNLSRSPSNSSAEPSNSLKKPKLSTIERYFRKSESPIQSGHIKYEVLSSENRRLPKKRRKSNIVDLLTNAPSSSQKVSESRYNCPACNVSLPQNSRIINDHLDRCLKINLGQG
eukprot:964031_1